MNSQELDQKKLDEVKNQFKTDAIDILKKLDPTFEETLYINIGESF
jgi:hypothetical protein